MADSEHGTVEQLRGLLEVTRLVNAGIRGDELRSAVAATVARSFGFGTVVINLHRPATDDFEVVTVHGSEQAAVALLGQTIDAATWDFMLEERFEVAGAYFLPAGSVDWSSRAEPAFIPDAAPLGGPDAWHPEDALFVPLRHSDGHLLGVLSCDEPGSGRRPRRTDLAVLASVAAHLAQALEAAQASEARERLLAEVRDAEERYRLLVERLPAVVYRAEVGEAGRWTYASEPIGSVLGFAPQEWIADPKLWISRVHPEDRAYALAQSERTARTGERMSREYRLIARDGRVVWVRDEGVVVEEASGPVIQGVMYDITAQKEAEEAIRNHSEILERTVAERTHDVEEARIETLQRLAFAAEYRDEETHLHTERVGRTAALLAQAVGLDDAEVAVIRQAAPLHDIGKLGVSDTILLTPGELDDTQRALMRAHTTIGARILSGSRSQVLQMGEQIALCHHERWDGSGYPRRLIADQIPVCGRLVAVADVFDALTHTRPYKEAWPLAHAVAEIERLAGEQFDPELVEAFAALDHEALLEAPPFPSSLRTAPAPVGRFSAPAR